MLELYRDQIIDRSQHPRFGGDVSHITHTAEGANRSCGDEVTWQLSAPAGRIVEIRHQSRACAICTASADLMAELLQGKPLDDIKEWNQDMVTTMLGIPLSPVRLKCALLPLEALKDLKET